MDIAHFPGVRVDEEQQEHNVKPSFTEEDDLIVLRVRCMKLQIKIND